MGFGDTAIGKKVKCALAPAPESDPHETGLTFTDILFGFVITQIFVRMQNWTDLSGYVRLQLLVSTALVLGSWIGFRQSLNRPAYKLRFFNLPLARFALDQLMILLYFRVAVLTPGSPDTGAIPVEPLTPSELTTDTLKVLSIVFALYLLWDLGGIWMGCLKKYETSNRDLFAPAITSVFLVAILIVFHVASETDVDASSASWLLGVATVLLVGYRVAKDIRSALKPKSEPCPPAESGPEEQTVAA
jgi:hypothetical protein